MCRCAHACGEAYSVRTPCLHHVRMRICGAVNVWIEMRNMCACRGFFFAGSVSHSVSASGYTYGHRPSCLTALSQIERVLAVSDWASLTLGNPGERRVVSLRGESLHSVSLLTCCVRWGL